MGRHIKEVIEESLGIKQMMAADKKMLASVMEASEMATKCLSDGGRILTAGNGGSAADAQHMAAEFVSRFMFDRDALSAVALTTDTSMLTAIGNDYGYEQVFSRQLEANGRPGDLLFAISTSGKSPNILRLLESATAIGIVSVALTGDNDNLEDIADVVIKIPSTDTARIQEGHLLVEHFICEYVEAAIFRNQ